MLLLVVVISFFLQTDIILEFFKNRGFNLTSLWLLLGVGVVGSVLTFFLLKKSKHPFISKIKSFLTGLLQGVLSIFKMKHKWAFLAHTFFIWAVYILMFWVIKYTVPETIALTTSQLLVAFVFGAFAMTATNGGIGLYPIAVSSALAIFGISSTSGDAFGWIMWISQTLMIVVFGAISFLVLPLWNRNN